ADWAPPYCAQANYSAPAGDGLSLCGIYSLFNLLSRLSRSRGVREVFGNRLGSSRLLHDPDLTYASGCRRSSPGPNYAAAWPARELCPPPRHRALDLPHMALRVSNRRGGLLNALPAISSYIKSPVSQHYFSQLAILTGTNFRSENAHGKKR